MRLADTLNLNPARQAGRILEAFAAGNPTLLHHELQRTQYRTAPARRGLEEERLELLQAVSEGMLRAGDPLAEARRDPAVRRCLDLLAHLAQARSVTYDSN
jgi:hypothetical protein